MSERVKRIHLDSVDSTNNYIKRLVLEKRGVARLGNSEIVDTNVDRAEIVGADAGSTVTYPGDYQFPLVVTADLQTAGRGRLGKSFHSPSGSGIYLSFAYERDYSVEELLQVTTQVANLLLPVMQKHTKDKLYIKPVNDIYRGVPGEPGSRKLAGILTEKVDYPGERGRYFLVVGIGINCFEAELPEALPEELREIVGFLEPDCTREELIEEEIEALMKLLG